MNEKEVAEIRRRFHQDKSNITHVHGCYVNEKSEIVAQFNQSLALMSQEECEKILAILKRTLSGTLGKNLIDLTFATNQVAHGEEHKRLMALRNSALGDEELVQSFFQTVIASLTLEGNYLILLSHDVYDIPFRSSDGATQKDASADTYSYILCSICPVKPTKPALSYHVRENEFHNCTADWLVSPPELGFLFPAFDDRSTNLYNALYYSRDIAESHEAFVDAIFHTGIPMPAAAQKETFESILSETLADDCKYEVVQAVHDQFCDIINEHKANKETEPLVLSKTAVRRVLQSCGVPEARVDAFDEEYDTQFGVDATLRPRNVVDTKQIEVRTADVTIRVSPDRSDLVQTRIIDGARYILIHVEDCVEVNGVNITID